MIIFYWGKHFGILLTGEIFKISSVIVNTTNNTKNIIILRILIKTKALYKYINKLKGSKIRNHII